MKFSQTSGMMILRQKLETIKAITDDFDTVVQKINDEKNVTDADKALLTERAWEKTKARTLAAIERRRRELDAEAKAVENRFPLPSRVKPDDKAKELASLLAARPKEEIAKIMGGNPTKEQIGAVRLLVDAGVVDERVFTKVDAVVKAKRRETLEQIEKETRLLEMGKRSVEDYDRNFGRQVRTSREAFEALQRMVDGLPTPA